MRGDRRLPAVGLVDAHRRAVGLELQVFRSGGEAERHAAQGLHRRIALARGLRRRRNGFREGRLEAEAAGAFDGAEQHLQEVDRAACVEAVGMSGDAAHRVHRHGATDELVVLAAGPVRPFDIERDRLVESDVRQLGRDAADLVGVDPALRGDRVRAVATVHVALGDELESRNRLAAVGERDFADDGRRDVSALGARQRLGRLVEAERIAVGVAREQAVVGRARRLDDQPGRIGVAHEIVEIDLVGVQQFVDQREHEQAVGAGADANPFVGDGRIAGAHGIYRDDLGAAALHLAEAGLDRVGIVILGDAEDHDVFRAIPVGFAEFPEGAADRVEAGGSHVDRAEAAVRGEVRRAVLHGPPACQRLALVAAGEEGELFRIGFADIAEPFGRERERFLPFDLDEFALAALADALQRLAQARRRIVLHDAGRALAAQDALVDRMVLVALDVADLAVLHVHLDAAAAGAHVTGRVFHLVGDFRRKLDHGVFEHILAVPVLRMCV